MLKWIIAILAMCMTASLAPADVQVQAGGATFPNPSTRNGSPISALPTAM